MYNVFIFGMGYVGLTFGVYASKKTKVIGIENNIVAANNIINKNISIVDSGILEELRDAIDSKNLVIHNSLYEIKDIDTSKRSVFIITPGTPLKQDGSVDLTGINSIIKDIKDFIKSEDLIILRSTVKLGVTESIGKEFTDDKNIHIGFCPERTLEGVALEELKNLTQIVGSNNKESFSEIKDFFNYINIKTLDRISVKEAELAKLLCNSERDLSFALANEIAYICEDLQINASNVINAATKDYARSSLKKPGIVGGPCLEKDPYILKQSVPSYKFKLLSISRNVNEAIVEKAIVRIKKNIIQNNRDIKKISILGCAFKGFPITADVRGSYIYQLREELEKIFTESKFYYHDFLNKEVNQQDESLNCSSNLIEVISNSDIIILQNNHPSYKELEWKILDKSLDKGCLIYDFWNQINSSEIENCKYISLGEGSL